MISYELHGYNSITLVILYMTNNIYMSFIRALISNHSALQIIFIVHIQLRGHITPPCFSEKHTCILFSILLYITITIDIPNI